jgi:nucleotide-binding universal stress UspA family protein/predicted transcriptional regulator
MAQTIIVPLDGSELAETALPWAALLAKQRGLTVTLVRVIPWPDIPAGEFGGYFSPEVYDEVLAAERGTAEEYLGRIRAQMEPGVQVSTVLREGLAPEGIHDVADEQGAYAVVMASHGRGGVARLVLGSVAERILHQATLPVFLIRASSRPRTPALQRILVPLDGSSLAERGLDQARELAAQGATLVLVRIVEPVYDVIAGDEAATVVNEEATVQAEADAEQYLTEIGQSLAGSGLQTETVMRRGRSANVLLSIIESAGVDAVVMTTHGSSGPTRWLLGSVADEVFRHTERPVFLVSARMLTARVTGRFAVRDLMTRDLEYVEENETVISVLRKLIRRRVSGAPVVNGKGELVGVISEHDLLAWHAKVVDDLSKDELNLDPARYASRIEQDNIHHLVSRPAVSIDESADLNAATRMLIERRLRRLAVTNSGRLVGIISRADVLKGMASNWETITGGSEE